MKHKKAFLFLTLIISTSSFAQKPALLVSDCTPPPVDSLIISDSGASMENNDRLCGLFLEDKELCSLTPIKPGEALDGSQTSKSKLVTVCIKKET